MPQYQRLLPSMVKHGGIMTEAEAENMGIVELFQRVVLLNEKIEGAPESA